MKIINFIGSRAFQLVSCLFVVAYLSGLLNNYFSEKNNYCAMTFMFEYPQYVKITLDKDQFAPEYDLYAYSEGRFTERARKMRFDGIPVLYLPGNSGSHMQARSIASVALRKALSRGSDYHFDFFTINYNEELSGLYGGVLSSQTQFAAACIYKILSLYQYNEYIKSIPTSVILIGHSMGGLIAKRLLAHPVTVNVTSLVLTLASPIEAPVINSDSAMNNYYLSMDLEWQAYTRNKNEKNKFLISIGSGPRDLLVPAGLTSSNDSNVNVLTTAIPGVWLSPDHISIVWCKQLVMVINRFLFDIVDSLSEQITEDNFKIATKAKQYFLANRSMVLDPNAKRSNVTMQADAFWYEDNRRIYQIYRPEIDRTSHLMIRLVTFPQNRFLAVEAINVSDKDWIFGCNAKYINNNYRYCKEATSLSELSRWTAAATDFGEKRKLATVNLHKIMEMEPQWTHVVLKVSPTRKPITLNVDTNDLASRQINVSVPWPIFTYGKQIVKAETEPNTLYYELNLHCLDWIHQVYLLYVEPINCQGQYHVSAELHVPWANHEMYHYFTHLKRSPMKLRLFKSNTNLVLGEGETQSPKVTLLLDPKCTFRISISHTWYHRIAQLARHYTPVLLPYVSAILLLATRINILHLRDHGTCVSIHTALMNGRVRPYYPLVFARMAAMSLGSIPVLSFMFETASTKNLELHYFTRSLLVVPAYMTAFGILNIVAAAVIIMMVFFSQIAHRFLFRIVWRGGAGLAENVAVELQKVPMLVSAALVCAVPLSCGAASLVAGAAFYVFMISKMYEEYLEDYVYKRMSIIASQICRIFKAKKESETKLNEKPNHDPPQTTISEQSQATENKVPSKGEENMDEKDEIETTDETKSLISKSDEVKAEYDEKKPEEIDEELNNINFHLMMFFLWMVVTVMNIPALLTWARNFKYTMILVRDTSRATGFVMSVCSGFVWQIKGPKRFLRHYGAIATLFFIMGVLVIAVGPYLPSLVNECVALMFLVITIQQFCDKDDYKKCTCGDTMKRGNESNDSAQENMEKSKESVEAKETNNKTVNEDNDQKSGESDVRNGNRIYNIFKDLKEKFCFNDEI